MCMVCYSRWRMPRGLLTLACAVASLLQGKGVKLMNFPYDMAIWAIVAIIAIIYGNKNSKK